MGCGWTGVADLWRHRALVRGAASPCRLNSTYIGNAGAVALSAALETNTTLTGLSCVWEKAGAWEGAGGLRAEGMAKGGEGMGYVEGGMGGLRSQGRGWLGAGCLRMWLDGRC